MKKPKIPEKKQDKPKEKHKIFSLKNIIKNVIIWFIIIIVTLFLIGMCNANQSDQTAEETFLDDAPLEEVRAQASNAFLTNDESVYSPKIEVGLG